MRSTLFAAALRLASRVALPAMLLTAQFARATAAPGPINFSGCDGVRSCHFLTFTFEPYTHAFEHSANFANANIVQLTATTEWYARGAFLDCSTGCAWDTEPALPILGPPDDVRHASGRCWSVSATMQPGLAHPCNAGTIDLWGSRFLADGSWLPQQVTLHLIYQDDVGSAVTVTSLQMTSTPEPSTYLLTAAGLASLLFTARRRRPSA